VKNSQINFIQYLAYSVVANDAKMADEIDVDAVRVRETIPGIFD